MSGPRFPHPPPHPEVPERSGGLEGGIQVSHGRLEGSFEAASPHFRMRAGAGQRASAFEAGARPCAR
ncbi:hypothetical protein FVE89_06035 [Methylobacterium sp. 2A]|nr:hypothetical protein [Methylobacterium sp. 2A]